MASPSSFVTPARPPRGSRSSEGKRSSVIRDDSDGDLTPSGAQILHAGMRRSSRSITLQVLGIFRYIVDPALRRLLPPRAMVDLHRDVFDVLLSDGQMKVKAMLSSSLNDLVWQGRLNELDVVEIDDYEVVVTDDKRGVCIVHELTLRTQSTASADAGTPQRAMPRAKIVYTATHNANTPSPSKSTAASTIPELQFISQIHIREHGAVPLAGERLYYLSLLSDDYPAEWEPESCEPLTPVDGSLPWAVWNRRRRYCTDVFTSGDRVIRTIREANLMTSKRKRADEDGGDEGSNEPQPPPPPMVGIVHFKSALTHLGHPDISNPFPFMFQIVLSDRERSVEIAFFGSMAAKNFLVVHEGDVIHVQNYTIDRSVPHRQGEKPKKLFLFPHRSNGIVSHVPEKFWRVLEITEVLPTRATFAEDDASSSQSHRKQLVPSSVWLEPTLVSTLHAQQWDLSDRDEQNSTYFDLVGVVSFVGRVHRQRASDDDAAVRAYRWLKLVDASCAAEMVVRVYVGSQPAVFHSLQAGDIALFTKLQWIDRDGLEFATTSLFSCLRLNDAVEPFLVFRDCADVFELAKDFLARVKTQYSAVDAPLVATTESWLEGAGVADFEPLYAPLAMQDTVPLALAMLAQEAASGSDDSASHWVPAFYPTMSAQGNGYSYPFKQVAEESTAMDALSHRYMRVHVQLHDVRVASATGDVELLVSSDDRAPQPLRLRPHWLFKPVELPKPLADAVAVEAEQLVRALSAAAIASLNASALLRSTELPQFSASPAKKGSEDAGAEEEAGAITVEVVKEYVMKHRDAHGGVDLALHVYRLPHGQMDLWVDAIAV